MVMSSQDFRNQYEKFYNEFRLYLWPYQVLETLAEVEVDIFTAFFDADHLRSKLVKLGRSVQNAVNNYEDSKLQQEYDAMMELLDELVPEEMYYNIIRVEEVRPDEDKAIKSEKSDEDNDEEDSESQFGFTFQPEENSQSF